MGSLLRRVCAGPGSRSKTQLVALLAAHAFRTGDLNLDDASRLYEAVHDPNIGVHAHLLLRRTRRKGDAVISDAFLVAAPGNEHAPHGTELAQPFRLVAHRDGVALLRQDSGELIDP